MARSNSKTFSYLANNFPSNATTQSGEIPQDRMSTNGHLYPLDDNIEPKTSGSHNLPRFNWSEDRCRMFLIKQAEYIPRNFNYADGLAILHPLLQEAFGDENMDLALAVLDEMIDVADTQPFIYCVYQRWKFDHRQRNENFENPHVPHASVVIGPMTPTESHQRYKDEQTIQMGKVYEKPHSIGEIASTVTTPTLPGFTGLSAHASHKNTGWRYGAGWAVSSKAHGTTVRVPTPAFYHKALWDENYGQRGKLISTRTVSVSELKSESLLRQIDKVSSQSKSLNNTKIAFPFQCMRDLLARAQSPSRKKYGNAVEYNVSKYSPAIVTEFDLTLHLGHQKFPATASIPNAIFARKYDLVPVGERVPLEVLQSLQDTATEQDKKRLQKVLHDAERVSNNEQHRMELFLTETSDYNKQPLTPAYLWADAGNDFDWDPINDPSSVPVSSSDSQTQVYSACLGSMESLELHLKSEASSFAALSSNIHLFTPNTQTAPNNSFNKEMPIRTNNNARETEDIALKTRERVRFGNENNFEATSTILLTPKADSSTRDNGTQREPGPASSSNSKNGDLIHNGLGSELKVRSAPPSEPDAPKRCLQRERTEFNCKITLPAQDLITLVTAPSTSQDRSNSTTNEGSTCLASALNSSASAISEETGYMLRPLTYKPPCKSSRAQQKYQKTSREDRNTFQSQDTGISNIAASIPATLKKNSSGIMTAKGCPMERSTNEGRETMLLSKTTESNHEAKTKMSIAMPLCKSKRRNLAVGHQTEELTRGLVVETCDGVGDERQQNINNQQSQRDNTSDPDRHNIAKDFVRLKGHEKYSMEFNYDRSWASYLTSPKPLQLHNQSSQLYVAPNQHPLNEESPYRKHTVSPVYPRRSSSLTKLGTNDAHELAPRGETTVGRAKGENNSFATSTATSRTIDSEEDCFDKYINGHSSTATATTTASDASSQKRLFFAESSTGIMGDFVPFGAASMRGSSTAPKNVNFPHESIPTRVKQMQNPYEFEPASLHSKNCRQTTFTEFTEGQDQPWSPNPRLSHTKNARSEDNTMCVAQQPPRILPSQPLRHRIYRSESSPNITPNRFQSSREIPSSSEIHPYYYGESVHSNQPVMPNHRGRSPCPEEPDYEDTDEGDASQSLNKAPSTYDSNRCHQQGIYTFFRAESPNHNGPSTRSRSPTKSLRDLYEHDEHDNTTDETSPRSPKKRSRSPMKKMFGENGWLGTSPNEADKVRDRAKKSTIIGKLINKLEEFAEKADMSPTRSSRTGTERHTKHPMLAVSLGSPEQARIYMELELMLVHTANGFLMSQFSQARIAVESIKKIVDIWKRKGRLPVIEFMYDQITQRDLVIMNQQTFRFHGDRAGNGIRINSMLYNWKQVASHMAIRTFCNADTIILKLIFDIEQILELLGAAEPVMLRLQHIRALANQSMRIARQETEH